MSFSNPTVIEAKHLIPRLRRITLRVEDPQALDVKPAGDSAVGIMFPGGEGRNYSVRRADGDRIVVDIVLHARGVATTWAAAAAPGDRVELDHARSWYRPEAGTEWQLLVADLAGLLAAARIIEQLPGGEAAESRAVRKYLRGAGWSVDQLDVTGYWRFDSEAWDTKYALVSEEIDAVWERAMAEGKSERVADEEYEDALERAGL